MRSGPLDTTWRLGFVSALAAVGLLGSFAMRPVTAAAQDPDSEKSLVEQATEKGEVPYVPPLEPGQRMAVADAIDTERTLRHIERLSRYHRPAPSPGLDRAMQYIERELRAAGLSDVETIAYKSDGKTTWWIEPAPPAWTCDAAELWIESPDRMQLADWKTDPVRVAAFSTSCDVTADVVEVTDWDDEQLDVEGKIVLTSGDARKVHARAVEAGALGLLLAPPVDPGDDTLRKAARQVSLSPDAKDWETNRFAFSVSTVEAAIIRTALEAGKRVRVKAVIENARVSPATAPIVTGRIEADKPTQNTILLIAEVAGPRPGANSVSGAAALLSLARSYVELIDDGTLMAPERRVQLLFVPDIDGARAYLKKRPYKAGTLLAVIHLGVVGTNTDDGPFKGRPVGIADGGWVLSSCVPYLALNFGRYCAQTGLVDVAGSDAPFTMQVHVHGPPNAHTVFYGGDIGAQTVSISYLPDFATASSIDTVDRLDPTSLTRTTYMALATAYALATPAQNEIRRFGPLMSPYIMHDLHGGLAVFAALLRRAPREQLTRTFTYIDTVMRINEWRTRDTGASLAVLMAGQEVDPVKHYSTAAQKTYSERAGAVTKLYHDRAERERVPDSELKDYRKKEVELRGEIPSMRWRGPVTLELLERNAPEVLPVPRGLDVTVLFSLIDGERVLYDVWGEHESMKWIGVPVPLPPPDKFQLPTRADLDETIAFLRRCAKAGVIRIRPKDQAN